MALFEKFDYGRKRKYLSNLPLENIIENINNILNTQKSYGSFLNDFGVLDFRDYQICDEFITRLINEIKNNIETFEPRMKINEITVEKVNKPGQIFLRVVSHVGEQQHIFNIVFDTSDKRLAARKI